MKSLVLLHIDGPSLALCLPFTGPAVPHGNSIHSAREQHVTLS